MKGSRFATLAAFLLLASFRDARGISGGHGGPPPDVPPGVPRIPVPPTRYPVGDYTQWWSINRDEFLLQLKPAEELAEYNGAPPDTLATLLSLIGYEGHFATIVKEVGIRRLRRVPKVKEGLAGVLKDANNTPLQRAWAAYALGELKARQQIPELKEALKERDLDLRGFSALALGKMEEPEAFEAILPLAADPQENEDLRCLVLLCLGNSELPEVRDTLVRVAGKEPAKVPDKSTTKEGCNGCGPCAKESPKGADLLILEVGKEPTKGPDKPSSKGNGKESPKGPGMQITAIRKDTSLPARRAAMMALGVKAREEDRKILQELCEDKDPYVRAAAVMGLGLAGGASDTLRKHLSVKTKETDGVVRSYAALALGISGSADVVPDLVACLEDDKDFNVRGCAALALGRIKAPSGMAALTKAMEDRNAVFVANYAAVGLGLTRKPEALAPLMKGLESKASSLIISSIVGLSILEDAKAAKPLLGAMENRHYPDIREFAVVGLGRLRDPIGFPRILDELKDPSMGGRHSAAIALAVYGDSKACPYLEKGLEDKDVFVRSGMALAFDLLTDDDKRPLTLGVELKGDPRNQTSRRVGLKEINRLLNHYLPKEYKLPITP